MPVMPPAPWGTHSSPRSSSPGGGDRGDVSDTFVSCSAWILGGPASSPSLRARDPLPGPGPCPGAAARPSIWHSLSSQPGQTIRGPRIPGKLPQSTEGPVSSLETPFSVHPGSWDTAALPCASRLLFPGRVSRACPEPGTQHLIVWRDCQFLCREA